MKSIAFIDIEVNPRSSRIQDIGCVKGNGESFHRTSVPELVSFLNGTRFICGHNIFLHDLKYIGSTLKDNSGTAYEFIDTLFWSPLLFPVRPYHKLVKDDKLYSEFVNNPVNDAKLAMDLFYDEINSFQKLDDDLKIIYYQLLQSVLEFGSFFHFVDVPNKSGSLELRIRKRFYGFICENVDLAKFILETPVELAYSLAFIHATATEGSKHSITPPWVLMQYTQVENIIRKLRATPCIKECSYCNQTYDIHQGLKRYFGYDKFRRFNEEPLQEKAVELAVQQKSILVIFPTGGGKSLTFQVPALMHGESSRSLTVVISPLQSLMKDQVDNLEKAGIHEAVTINGLLDPIERAQAIERVENGSATMLYIAPESLRSKTIEHLLLRRKISRIVIDEAHCFSAWGQDFRIDYLYIADFIRELQEKKRLDEPIPVSCFTATAKPQVIEEIQQYFRERLGLNLKLVSTKASRSNLQYKIIEKKSQEDKYQALRSLLEQKKCPTIIYVSRTHRAEKLAETLARHGYVARPFHGKMDKAVKANNQDAFIRGDVQIMVATSAFGMGVDKRDVGMVIHYEISDSLENYIQEAGRAGRDESITADCYVLFDEEDLIKHFILLNQTKLNIKEIQQVWKAIKELTKFRSKISNSALEIARQAGWDDSILDIETRVTSAIAALEEAGYLKRGQNSSRIFANSILVRSAQDAIDRIMSSSNFNGQDVEYAIPIIKKLFSSKSRKYTTGEDSESRVDYISDSLGIPREQVIRIINLFREENILADAKDLTAFIRRDEQVNRSMNMLNKFRALESFLEHQIDDEWKILNLKELNEQAESEGLKGVSVRNLNTILNFWAIKQWIVKTRQENASYIAIKRNVPRKEFKELMEKRHLLARYILHHLYNISLQDKRENDGHDNVLVDFSIKELIDGFTQQNTLFPNSIRFYDVEDTLFFLSRIEAIHIEGGFIVTYNRLTIERSEESNRKLYTKDNYQKLGQFYENRIQQIHIVGEYARMMVEDYKKALEFVDDYFQLNYSSFLQKYFRGDRLKEIVRNITRTKFNEIFGALSPAQLKIINDKSSSYIVVTAGPGSGKTRVLVHKLASLLLMEDVKHDQLLMLTFSRAAATEFKKRLIELIGNAAAFVEIKTFHSYCFDLLGKVGNLESSDNVVRQAVQMIEQNEVEPSRLAKAVLVIDEAQDMSQEEFDLVKALIKWNEDLRVIAVGDDDQHIFGFRGSSPQFMRELNESYGATQYELVENYRSKSNLVAFANELVSTIRSRLKHTPIMPHQTDHGALKLVQYKRGKFMTPVVQDILDTGLAGSTCVLTQKNIEAEEITGMLRYNNMPAKLIQTNDSFSLYNLFEIRYFIKRLNLGPEQQRIDDESWKEAKRAFKERFNSSSKLEVIHQLISDFEQVNPKGKYRTDFEIFVKESKLEDFYYENRTVLHVSTIHKAKGKEYDNVFLMLDGAEYSSDDQRRLLYVGVTRARNLLHVHYNNDFISRVNQDYSAIRMDSAEHPEPHALLLSLTHHDVALGFFAHNQNLTFTLTSGDELQWDDGKVLRYKGQKIIWFSNAFQKRLKRLQDLRYAITSVRINHMVFWYNEERKQELLIILPELYIEKVR